MGRGGGAPAQQLERLTPAAQFIDVHGLEEAGVDGGGIFKEFLELVVKDGFDPNVGLFRATTDQRLYPNPHAALVVGSAMRLIEFLGKMLGKAMFEGEARLAGDGGP